MELIAYRWDGVDLNTATRLAWISEGSPEAPSASVRFVELEGAYPAYAGKGISEYRLSLMVECRSAQDEEWVRSAFDVFERQPKNLEVYVGGLSGTRAYVRAAPQAINLAAPGLYEIVLAVLDPYWIAYSESSTGGTVTDASPTLTVNATTTFPALPVIAITPSGSGGGYRYRRFIPVYNRLSTPLTDYPIEITGGGWDTAALVSAGKMRSDGGDLRVWANGKEIERWLVGMNTTSTKVWVTLSLPQFSQGGYLRTAIPSSGQISEIALQDNSYFQYFWSLCPQSGVVLIDSELFTYTGKDGLTKKLTGVERAYAGSTAAAHSVGAQVIVLPYDLWVAYGNSAQTPPTQTDAKKPLLLLSSSSNTTWVWPGDDFGKPGLSRPPAWMQGVLQSASPNTIHYYNRQENLTAQPALGMRAQTYKRSGVWKSETFYLRRGFYHPAGIATVAADGAKFRSSTAWGSTAALRSTNSSWLGWGEYEQHWSEAAPTAANLWQTWTRSAVSTGNRTAIYFEFSGSLPSADHKANFEIWNVTVTLNSSNIPYVGAMLPELWQRHFDLTITNQTTGEAISLYATLSNLSEFWIDCAEKTVYMAGKYQKGVVVLNRPRPEWLRLVRGTNVIHFESSEGLGTINVTVHYRGRL